jgi:hypothetical protein
MLDQFFINKNMATGDARSGSTQRLCKSSNCRPWSIQVSIRSQSHWAEWASRSNQTGFSDYFPIIMTVTEVD